ncbi:uncharacterized protein TNCV_4576671 [Trichonephila clavipes]|nr:uncharacterized protein TNCV_4576671 [Trichonephila clavipes]
MAPRKKRSGTKNNSSPNEPSYTTVTVSFNGVLLVVTGTWRSPYQSPARIRLQTKHRPGKTSHKTTIVETTTHALYSRFIAGDITAKYIRILIRRCNSGETCASTHITIILKSLPNPGEDTLGDSKFLGYFQLGTSTFQSSNSSTM